MMIEDLCVLYKHSRGRYRRFVHGVDAIMRPLVVTYLVILVAVVFAHAHFTLYHPDVLDVVKECVMTDEEIGRHDNVSSATDTFLGCMHQFLWKTDLVDWSLYNITAEKMDYTKSLVHSAIQRGRVKRQTPPLPPTGFRIRREYRRLTDADRNRVHQALREMKFAPIGLSYDDFANWHTGIVTNSAHGGPNFLGWHRIYLVLVEEEMRRHRPGVSLPYWDSRLDFYMADPTMSVIWSPEFLGTGFGIVNDGPFAFWLTSSGPLTRNINSGSTLINRLQIGAIMSRCFTAQIVPPSATPDFNLEFIHGGPHTWVGGQFSLTASAAHDPIFFMHHAFIDYIWEMFRFRQATTCGVNPTMDYPPGDPLHQPFRVMDAIPQYRNIDGYALYWTQSFYNYERSPRCSPAMPFCGSPYLVCDVARWLCVSVERMDAPIIRAAAGAAGLAGSPGGAGMVFAMRSREQASRVGAGPSFQSPPSDPRTQDAQGMNLGGRMKRSIKGRRLHKTLQSKELSIPPAYSNAMIQDLVVVPVTVFYLKPATTDVFNASGGYLKLSTEKTAKNKTASFVSPASCFSNASTAVEIKLTAIGLSSHNHRSEHVYVDASHGRASILVDLWVTAPTPSRPSEVALSAEDKCGRMCVPICLVPQTHPVKYRPCTGVITVSSASPLQYIVQEPWALPDKARMDNHQNLTHGALGFSCGNDASILI